MKNLYLDIDGTILTKQGALEARHLLPFLLHATTHYDCYFLTSHCKGDTRPALEYIENKVSKECFELLKGFKPTTFGMCKTNAIDFTKDFIWLDDYVFNAEIEVLKKHNALDKLIVVDLKTNPNQLLDIISIL